MIKIKNMKKTLFCLAIFATMDVVVTFPVWVCHAHNVNSQLQ
jgi:hypothetical protein